MGRAGERACKSRYRRRTTILFLGWAPGGFLYHLFRPTSFPPRYGFSHVQEGALTPNCEEQARTVRAPWLHETPPPHRDSIRFHQSTSMEYAAQDPLRTPPKQTGQALALGQRGAYPRSIPRQRSAFVSRVLASQTIRTTFPLAARLTFSQSTRVKVQGDASPLRTCTGAARSALRLCPSVGGRALRPMAASSRCFSSQGLPILGGTWRKKRRVMGC